MGTWVEIDPSELGEKIRGPWGRFSKQVSFAALLTIRQFKAPDQPLE